jgi:hypothetical protein
MCFQHPEMCPQRWEMHPENSEMRFRNTWRNISEFWECISGLWECISGFWKHISGFWKHISGFRSASFCYGKLVSVNPSSSVSIHLTQTKLVDEFSSYELELGQPVPMNWNGTVVVLVLRVLKCETCWILLRFDRKVFGVGESNREVRFQQCCSSGSGWSHFRSF